VRVTLRFYNAATGKYEEREELSPQLHSIDAVGVGTLPNPGRCNKWTRNVGKINSVYTVSNGDIIVYVEPTFR
jgi:hypothetical protein